MAGTQDLTPDVAREFIADIRDDLERLEPDLLAMEELGGHVSCDLVNNAFRAVHSIKGGAGFSGLTSLGDLAHSMENVLMAVRDNRISLVFPVPDVLLAGLDRMKAMVAGLDSGIQPSCEKEKRALEALNPSPGGAVRPGRSDSSLAERMGHLLDPGVLREAVARGMLIHAVEFDPQQDFVEKNRKVRDLLTDIEGIGELVFADFDQATAPGDLDPGHGPFTAVIATILDTEFLAQVLEVETGRIIPLDPDAMVSPEPDTQAAALPEATGNTMAGPAVPNGEPQALPAATIRVNVELITRLMNLAGELVLSRNRLRPLVEGLALQDAGVSQVMQSLNTVSSLIQEDIMRLRMQPFGKLVSRFRRIVRDLAKSLGKEVDLLVEGGEVELDKGVLEGLANPFTHLVRNCVDHGIETPYSRTGAGKPPRGTIRIRVHQQGGHIHVCIQDDGRGIDPDAIGAAAVDKGLVTREAVLAMTDKEKISLVFTPGFSTSKTITDLSGRGVGLDVVKTNIENLRGRIGIESTPGQGTQVRITIPLTLVIVSALAVGTGGLRFAIPQMQIQEVFHLKPGELKTCVERVAGADVIGFRGRLLPVVRLRTLLEMETRYFDAGTRREQRERRSAIFNPGKGRDRRRQPWGAVFVFVLKQGTNRFGLLVEELFDTEEIVVTPLGPGLENCPCFSGSTFLGDRGVIMILDAPGMAGHAGLEFEAVTREEKRRMAEKEGEEEQGPCPVNFMLFSFAPDDWFAVPLEALARLEAIRPLDIRTRGQLRFMDYKGRPMLLFFLDEIITAASCDFTGDQLHVIVPRGPAASAGIVVGPVMDTVAFCESVDTVPAPSPGIRGSAVIGKKRVRFLDMAQISRRMEILVKAAGYM
ncbi:MAG: chemotaxis protein CheA [Desulfobacteraceae bacterium]|nr:chemotaxis protein CheA [Desulfobacteraceae bacterium]